MSRRKNKQRCARSTPAYRRSCRTTPRGRRYSSRSSSLSYYSCVLADAVVRVSSKRVCRGALVCEPRPISRTGKVQQDYPTWQITFHMRGDDWPVPSCLSFFVSDRGMSGIRATCTVSDSSSMKLHRFGAYRPSFWNLFYRSFHRKKRDSREFSRLLLCAAKMP